MQSAYSVFKSNASLPSAQTTLVTPGSPLQLSTVSIPCAKIFLTAGRDNVGTLTVGDSHVKSAATTSGDDVQPGGGMTIEIDDLSKVWIDGTNANDTWSFSFLS